MNPGPPELKGLNYIGKEAESNEHLKNLEINSNNRALYPISSNPSWESPMNNTAEHFKRASKKHNAKLFSSVQGPQYTRKEMEMHLKYVRNDTLLEYNRSKDERDGTLNTFRSKPALRYTDKVEYTPSMKKPGAFEWDQMMHEKLQMLASLEHPKTFKAADKLKMNRLVLPRVENIHSKGLNTNMTQSPFLMKAAEAAVRGKKSNTLNNVPTTVAKAFGDLFLRESLQPTTPRRLESIPISQQPNILRSKNTMHLVSQSCDVEVLRRHKNRT